ncbi:MAG TPA: glycosyltransferase family 2 protein [Solirubrobacteraceae bacterium]|nr:glycosyltransferase family 2 protein [Solirubrobacteraceae bacterium]
MEQLPITLCVSTRNAAADLPDCIESVRSWVSEIVVVDMDSDDETCKIARAAGAKVVSVPPAGWAEPGRQAGIDAATQPWMLVLDADERAGAGLAALAAACVVRDDLAGMWLPRQNFQFGWWTPSSGIWPDWQLRLFRPDLTTWPGHRTHVGPQVAGHVERAPTHPDNAIVHHSFPTISAWVASANRYTDIEADHLQRSGRRPRLLRALVVPLMRFGDLYLRNRGYRSGRYGLTVAMLSFCYWTLVELKLWERSLSATRLPVGSVPQQRHGSSAISAGAGAPSSSVPGAP